MRRVGFIVLLSFSGMLFGQNLEFLNGKDFKQPGKLNPAYTGAQEDLIRIISDVDYGKSLQLMVEGRLPLKLGNYMVGIERTYTPDASNNMVNITYGRKYKGSNKNINWRYGGTLQLNQRSITIPGYDSGYKFQDLNGQMGAANNVDDFRSSFDFMDLDLGVSVNSKNIFAGVALQHILGQNVSFVKSQSRSIPIAANFSLGGFLNLGSKLTVFPNVLMVVHQNESFRKASMDFATDKFNISGSYSKTNQAESINGSVGFKLKKVFTGLKYSHPLSDPTSAILPRFSLFLNSTVFKSRDLFKSDFAKQMKKFY